MCKGPEAGRHCGCSGGPRGPVGGQGLLFVGRRLLKPSSGDPGQFLSLIHTWRLMDRPALITPAITRERTATPGRAVRLALLGGY